MQIMCQVVESEICWSLLFIIASWTWKFYPWTWLANARRCLVEWLVCLIIPMLPSARGQCSGQPCLVSGWMCVHSPPPTLPLHPGVPTITEKWKKLVFILNDQAKIAWFTCLYKRNFMNRRKLVNILWMNDIIQSSCLSPCVIFLMKILFE